MVLERLKRIYNRLLRRQQETLGGIFDNIMHGMGIHTPPESGAEVHRNDYIDTMTRMMEQLRGSQMIHLEPNPNGEPIMMQTVGPGSIILARVESDSPISPGMLLQRTENGNLEPVEFDEMTGPPIAVAMEQSVGTTIMRVQTRETFDRQIPVDENGGGILAETTEQIIHEISVGALHANDLQSRMLPPRPSIVPNKYDKKYPHICFECKQKLQYKHALGKAKDQGFTEEQHKKMWKSAVVEYYCCTCYDRKQGGNHNHTGPFSSLTMLEHIRRSMANAGRRWGGGHPQWHMGQNGHVEFVDGGHRCLRIIGELDEILYQEEPRNIDPIVSDEVITPEHQPRDELGIHVRVVGGIHHTTGIPYNCDHSARRIVYTPLPNAHRDIHFEENFPQVNNNEKLIAIAQIYTQWFMKVGTIDIRHTNFPHFIRAFIDRIINHLPFTLNYYNDMVRSCGSMIEEHLLQQDTMNIADYRERVLWRGYNVERPVNRVELYGGIVDGNRLEAEANGIQENGVHTFIDNHPEIINQEELNNLAQDILNRSTGNSTGVLGEHFTLGLVDCPHHEFTERGECQLCGITMVQLDMLRSTRLAEHHRMGTHNFESINGEMLCRICRLSPMEIDRNRNMQQVPRSRT